MNYLTPQQVAARMSLHPSTVIRMCCAGRFRGAVTVGCGKRQRWRVPEASLAVLDEPRDAVRVVDVGLSGDARAFYDELVG